MPKLTPSQVRDLLPDLDLKPAAERHLLAILELAWDEHERLSVARHHQALFPLVDLDDTKDRGLANANLALNRLIKAFNQAAAASANRQAFSMRITADKRAGPLLRFIWFEGPGDEPQDARTDELDGAQATLVTDQLGVPMEQPAASGDAAQAQRDQTHAATATGDDQARSEIAGRRYRSHPWQQRLGARKVGDADNPPDLYLDLDRLDADSPPDLRLDLDRLDAENLLDNPACETRLHQDLDPTAPARADRDQAVKALDYLLDWAKDPAAPPLFALLGEYGMGKTVTCQRLYRTLTAARAGDPRLPLALYFDLRLVSEPEQRLPTVVEVCETCMARGWKGRAMTRQYGVEDLMRWLRAGALIIFDGLDEVLVRLTGADGQRLTRGLLDIRDLVPEAPAPKVLISCRTHYFRTLKEQRNHFTGQERTRPAADDYRALILLPLDQVQVRGYLEKALPDQDPDRLMDTLAAVHNLSELSQRPYTLQLISENLAAIERQRAAGKPVYGVTLYRGLVERWLLRDDKKHHILPEDKLSLAEHLAAYLWQEGTGILPVRELESWLLAWLDQQPTLRPRYARLHPDRLEEDLRTATFLVRDDAADGFRFAHTSLLEFFLSGYLFQAIADDAPERWALKTPSPETLDFLGQRLAERAAPHLLPRLAGWRLSYRPGVSELLLDYGLRALARGWPAPDLRGIALTGADLSDRLFRNPPDRPPLDLSRADLSGAVLRRTVFDGVPLAGASFRDAELTQASILDCDASGSDWSGARCDGTTWRRVTLTDARWSCTRGRGAEFIRCDDLAQASSVGSNLTSVSEALDARIISMHATRGRLHRPPLALLAGHAGPTVACAFSLDGRRLLSGGTDGTLRLWDTASGAELLRCEVQGRVVRACAFSPDATRLLSGGSDGTLRLWDARTGAELLRRKGQQGVIDACSFSPDGKRLLSGGRNGTLRLWDAGDGAELLRWKGQDHGVAACAFSPDGTQLLSADHDGTVLRLDAISGKEVFRRKGPHSGFHAHAFSPDGTRLLSGVSDGTLRLWDTTSGAEPLRYGKHRGYVTCCACSPDNTQLLSGSCDGTLRLWDAITAAELRCEGHAGTVSVCTFSPDGTRLLSGGDDGTLRLWDAITAVEVLRLEGNSGREFVSYGERPIDNVFSFSLDGTRLLSRSPDGLLRLWDGHSGVERLRCEGWGWVRACAFSPDATRVLSGGRDGNLQLWDALRGIELKRYEGHKNSVLTCAISPDGTRMLSGGEDGTLRLWDGMGSTELWRCDAHVGSVYACAFNPDGTRLLSAGKDGKLRVWDAVRGTERLCVQQWGWVHACAFSPDGNRLVSGGRDGTLQLWDSRSGANRLRCGDGRDEIYACAFSPDGTRLLSGGCDGTLRLWDAITGVELLRCEGHAGTVSTCAFSPDGSRLLSGGSDGTLRLWDADSGELLRIHTVISGRWPGHAVWEPPSNRLIAWSGYAWRWLRWAATDADGHPDPLPLETYPDLPPPDDH